MRASIAVSLFALGLAQASSCKNTSCYKSLVDDCNIDIAEDFCPEFAKGTPTSFPEEFECDDIAAVSAACACFLKPTSTASVTKPYSSGGPHTGGPHWSTSTVYETQVHTYTQCPPEVVDCPLRTKTGNWVVTKTVAVSTTICPVEEAAPTKPAANPSGPKPKPTKGCTGENCPEGPAAPAPKPTKPACNGADCAHPTAPAPAPAPVSSRPVVAGASSVAGGLVAVLAGVAAALF